MLYILKAINSFVYILKDFYRDYYQIITKNLNCINQRNRLPIKNQKANE